MKKNILKYLSILLSLIFVIIIYFSLIGIETDRFNNQIKDRLSKINSNLDINLKKIKLTLDPLNFKFNAKTIGAKIIYKKRNIELESIKTQISINSFIKNKIVSSNLIISTKSVLLKDLVGFLRTVTNKTELFILEKAIDKGFAILDLEVNFDENDSTEIRGKALRRVFIILANRGEYASALQVHDEIMESDLASDVKDSSQKMAEKIQRMVDSDARLKRSITLESTREPETGLSMERHRLSRRVVGLDEIEGQLDHVDLRCDFHRAVTEAKSGTGLRLPEEWGDCRIYVFGEPGAKFKIVEYAESEFSEAPST